MIEKGMVWVWLLFHVHFAHGAITTQSNLDYLNFRAKQKSRLKYKYEIRYQYVHA